VERGGKKNVNGKNQGWNRKKKRITAVGRIGREKMQSHKNRERPEAPSVKTGEGDGGTVWES